METEGLLVVAAYEPELAGLPDSVSTRAVGIGAIDAAAGTARAIAELAPSHITVVGTCGAFPASGLAIGDRVVVERAVWQRQSLVCSSTQLGTVAHLPGRVPQSSGELTGETVSDHCGLLAPGRPKFCS